MKKKEPALPIQTPLKGYCKDTNNLLNSYYMFSEISELKSIREQKSRISERERELSAPILQDVELIKTIWAWFREIQDERDCPSRSGGTQQRKMFIFIILFLYSPSVLAGGRIPNGLRESIAMAIDWKDRTFISHNIESVVFLYQNYKDFRSDIDYLYIEIESRLRGQGLIK